jgi:integrase
MLASGDYAPSTINRYCSAFRRLLTLAVQEHKINRHPMKGMKFLPEAQHDRFFTEEELNQLHDLLSPEEWRAVAVALGTGMRLREQLGLKWQYIDWESQTASIPLSKSGKVRRVPLSADVLTILREQFSESAYVFPHAVNPTEASRCSTSLQAVYSSPQAVRHCGRVMAYPAPYLCVETTAGWH